MTSAARLAAALSLTLLAAACSGQSMRAHRAARHQPGAVVNHVRVHKASPQERAAVIRALDPWWRRPAVAACVPMQVRIAGDYATVETTLRRTQKCLRFASNGYTVLKRTDRRWHQIWVGSDAPACTMHVPRSLISWCMKQ